MKRIFRRLSHCFSLLLRGRLFSVMQAVSAAVLPNRLLGMKKSLFYRLSRENVRTRTAGDVEIFSGNGDSVREIVRDLYGDDPRSTAFYEDFCRRGIEPWIARREKKIVGVVWLFTGSYLAPWEGYDAWLLRIEVEPTAKFVANVFVDPAERGRGVFALIASACFAAYPDSPFYSCVDEANEPSVRSHEKIGFRRCAVAYYVRLGRKTRCLFRTKNRKSRLFTIRRGLPVEVALP